MDLTGNFWEGEFVSERYYPKAVFQYALHLPKGAFGREDLGLIVCHDGFNRANAAAAESLAQTGEMPWCVTVGVMPGKLYAGIENGCHRSLRMHTYDAFVKEYPLFLTEELLPYLIQTYELHISSSPDMHMVSGGSSGGISAWNIAWHRTDYFHRVYMSSPSFLSMGKGNELLSLIRKYETKPIRVYTEYSEHEPDDYFGSSFLAAEGVARALQYAGYEVMSRFYPGEGHCSRITDFDSAVERMKFLWKNWQTEPIRVHSCSKRMEKVILPGCDWEESTAVFPKKQRAVSTGMYTAKGEYTFENGQILFVHNGVSTKVSEQQFENISSLLISSDKWRLYAGDKNRACIYALTIEPDGSLSGCFYHGALHTNTDFKIPGAIDMCLDSEDRLYVATELGIQSVRAFGLIDVILSNPNNQPAEQIEIGEDGYLYARAGEKVYRRKLNQKLPALPEIQTEIKCGAYYD